MKRGLLLVLLAVLCASCRVDIGVDVTMNDDGSGIITITGVADADVVRLSPNIGTDLRFDDVIEAGWLVNGPAPTENGGIQVILTHTFQNPAEATQLLASIGGDDGPFVGITLDRRVVAKTTTFTLNGTLQLTGGLEAFSDTDLTDAVGATPFATQIAGSGLQPSDAVGISFSTTLPGTINNTTGTVTAGGNGALTWQVPFDETAVDVATLSELVDTRNSWASPVSRAARIGLIAWGAISFCIIAYVMFARRRRRIANQPWYEP